MNILLTLLFLLFVATVLKRVTDRVVRVKSEGDEETFFSFFRSDFNVEAANKIAAAVGSYRPPWWYSANLGTMVAFGQDFDCPYDEEVVEAADGCRFIVSWFPRRPYLNGDLDGNPLETAVEGDVGRKQIVLYVPGLGLHAESVSSSVLRRTLSVATTDRVARCGVESVQELRSSHGPARIHGRNCGCPR